MLEEQEGNGWAGRFLRPRMLTNCLQSLRDFLSPPEPEKPENERICTQCFESGATKRKCCNRLYCDHCYTKNRSCPYCHVSTRQEKMTGATFAVEAYSEIEECRCCLELGIKRKCCGSYYCDDCFYKIPQCRFCEAPVAKASTNFKGVATVISVIISWLATIFFIIIVVAFCIVMSANEAQTKVLMSGYKCYGLFKDCTVDICADMDPRVAPGDIAIPALADWKPCTLASTVKVSSKACVFDAQLFNATNGVMGFDLCMDKFQNGVYILEDTFDAWTNSSWTSNKMKSALWTNIVNAHATPYCGVAQSLGGVDALVFSGNGQRYAETQDLDISSGGWLEAALFISPIGFDVRNPFCKSSYSGGVDVEFSIDQGLTWTMMQHFDAYVWRQETFFPVRFEVPPGSRGATASTRFQFVQRAFDAARDQWALDNVRVLRYLPPDWHTVQGFTQNVQRTLQWMQRAQCCFDTDWCETRLSLADMDDCSQQFSWYGGRRYLLRGSELYIMIIVLVNIIKFVYISGADYLIKGRMPFYSEWEDLTKMDRFMKYLPARYRPKKTLESFSGNVHLSARLGAELMDAFKDDEGSGEAKLTKEDQDALKKAELERLRKEKKKLKQRMKKKKFQGSSLGQVLPESKAQDEEGGRHNEDEDEDDDDDEPDTRLEMLADPDKKEDKGETELDKFKKSNVGMLRQPFDTRVDHRWIKFFRNYNIFLLGLFTVIKIGTTSYYEVYQPLLIFGKLRQDLTLTSLGIFFFAFCCDLKELYFALKNIVPCRPEWVPYITIDLQEDISALFIGEHVISLKDIGEIVPFPVSFALFNAMGFFLGCFPWCLFAIILRDQFLNFASMRIVTPALAIIALLRAILGPAFVVKCSFSLFYLLTFDPKLRERAGVACQAIKTRYSAVTGACMIGILTYIMCGIVANEVAMTLFGYGVLAGLFYGAFTGCIHGLPIRPWMVLTCLRGGVWMRVKKKQRCPCLYWGAFCSDMHDADEVFVVYTTDDVRFLGLVKGGTIGGA